MNSSPSSFERFLTKVHRRFVVLRVLEVTGLGVLAGCALGVPLAIVAIWQNVSTVPLAEGALALGAIGGLLTGIFLRPSLYDAATEADRQLDTSDLLSTALSMRHNPDPWAGLVMASADRWSARVTASSVILNRLGARAWGGIGLATALLLVLSLFPTYASPIQAADHSTSPSKGSLHEQPAIALQGGVRRTAPEQNPEDLSRNPLPEGAATSRPASPSGKPSDAGQPNAGRDAAQGQGESHTAFSGQGPSNSTDATQSRTFSIQGSGADGAGRSAQNAAPGNSTASHASASESTTPSVPWKSPQWPQQAQQALHALDTGQVPDAYRDVIHDYFEHH